MSIAEEILHTLINSMETMEQRLEHLECSSSMPHKENPTRDHIIGLEYVLDLYEQALTECIKLGQSDDHFVTEQIPALASTALAQGKIARRHINEITGCASKCNCHG